jgi:C-terminal processing protease CtpA/Prc
VILAENIFIDILIYKDYFQSSQFCVPYFTKPEKQLMSYHKIFSYFYPAETKRFEGEFVFLIDWRTYGKGEGFASVVKDFGIGTLIGEDTQGALITATPIRLDADFTISIGTMYGYSPAGKLFLNSPIEPDIRVNKSSNNLNSDVILQRAIDFLMK